MLVGGWLAERYGSGGDAGVAAIFGLETILQDIGAVTNDMGLSVPFWVRAVVNLLGAAVVLGAAYVWFRPPKDSVSLEARDEARVRALLRGFGNLDSLGYFATRRDKAVVWDTDSATTRGRASPTAWCGAVSLASGTRSATRSAGRRRSRLARAGPRQRLVAGRHGAPARRAPRPTRAGLDAFEIGDEAILDIADFSLERPGHEAGAPGRHRLRAPRVHRPGRPAQRPLTRPDFDRARGRRGAPGAATAVTSAASRWRWAGWAIRWTVTASWSRSATARESARACSRSSPWGRNGLSLDLMRRDPQAENGSVEMMVDGLAAAGPAASAWTGSR